MHENWYYYSRIKPEKNITINSFKSSPDALKLLVAIGMLRTWSALHLGAIALKDANLSQNNNSERKTLILFFQSYPTIIYCISPDEHQIVEDNDKLIN